MSYTFLTPGLDAMTIWNELGIWDRRQRTTIQATRDGQTEVPAISCEDDCHFCLGPETD